MNPAKSASIGIWGGYLSNIILLKCGVRQGGVLSPHFFAIYVNDIIKLIQQSNFGCKIGIINVSIFLYADDIILLAPSVDALQRMLILCENHLRQLDMALNAKKSVCLRIGARYKDDCHQITTLTGESLCWVDKCRYLGVVIIAAKRFSISLTNNKQSFYRSCNAIFSKIGHCASEEVIIKLISAKCMPMLTYGLDVCPMSAAQTRTLDFIITRVFMRIFRTRSVDTVNECQLHFGSYKISDIVARRKSKFLHKFRAIDNEVCMFLAG
jgi:hypothetical protein